MANLIRYITQEDPMEKMRRQKENENPDASAGFFNTPSRTAAQAADPDHEIRERMYPIIKAHEGNKNFPYKDSVGKITIGAGINIDDEDKFRSMEWMDEQKRRIRPDDAVKYRNVLHEMEGNNYKADYYEDKTPLRIADEEIRRLYDMHVNNDLKELRDTFKDFDRFPPELQNVLLDIKYNTGNVLPINWPNLHKAIAKRSIKGILDNVHRYQVGIKRNQWAEDEIRKIKRLNY